VFFLIFLLFSIYHSFIYLSLIYFHIFVLLLILELMSVFRFFVLLIFTILLLCFVMEFVVLNNMNEVRLGVGAAKALVFGPQTKKYFSLDYINIQDLVYQNIFYYSFIIKNYRVLPQWNSS